MADDLPDPAVLRRRSATQATIMFALLAAAGVVALIGLGAQLPGAGFFRGASAGVSDIPVTAWPQPTDFLAMPGGSATTVNLRAAPNPAAEVLAELPAGTRVTADAQADGADGAPWLRVRTVDGTQGFIIARRLQPAPDPAVSAAADPAAATSAAADAMGEFEPTPETAPAPPAPSNRPPRPPRPPVVRPPAPPLQQPRAPQGPPVTCILPSGEEVQIPRDACRARDGVVF